MDIKNFIYGNCMLIVRRGFTLIEMLIVIVIIGILASALIPRLQSVQSRARDTKRKTDLRTIYNANEIYRLDNGSYMLPAGVLTYNQNAIGIYAGTDKTGWKAMWSGLMTSVPTDPIDGANGILLATGYTYAYHSVWAKPYYETYDLMTNLENASDPDRCTIKQYRYQSTVNGKSSLIWCAPGSPGVYPGNAYAVGPGQ